jgi:hypothetical protein
MCGRAVGSVAIAGISGKFKCGRGRQFWAGDHVTTIELVVETSSKRLPVPFHRYRRYNSSTARWVVSSATTRAHG